MIDLGGFDYATSVVIQADGKIVVAGAREASPPGRGSDFAVARLLSDGTPDPGFAGDGSTTMDFGSRDLGSAAVVQPDGKIVVVGGTSPGPSGKDDMAVARFLVNGSPDPGFGTGGQALVDFGAWEDGIAIALRPDGRILIAGSTAPQEDGTMDIAIAQLQGGDPPAPPGAPGAGGPGGAAGPTGSAPASARRSSVPRGRTSCAARPEPT